MALSFQDKIRTKPTSELSFVDKVRTKEVQGEAQQTLNYAQRIGQQYATAGQDILAGIKGGAKQIEQGDFTGSVRAGLRTVGGVAGATFAPIMEAPVVKPALEALGGAISKIPGVKSIAEKVSKFAERRPVLAKDIENLVDIAALGGVSAARKPVVKKTAVVAGKAATRLEKGLQEQTLKEALDVVKPVLTPKEKTAALVSERGVVSKRILPRQFESTTLAPTAKETEMAKVVVNVVNKSKHPVDNIGALGVESRTIGQKIRAGLEESEAIWNKNELKARISKVERPISVKSDTTLNRQADNFNKAIFKLADEADKKAVGILDVRQKFDDLVKKEFPNLYDKEMTPTRLYVSRVRQSLNEFAESRIPEGRLPDGTKVTEELRRQHLMLDAKENIAEKAISVVDVPATKRAMNALRKNVLVYAATGGILTFGAMIGLLSNPIIIGGLILGTSLKIGKTIITAKVVRKSLVSVLRMLEEMGKTADASAIRGLLDQLPEQ